VELLDFIPTDRPEDTIKAAEMMQKLDIACLIVVEATEPAAWWQSRILQFRYSRSTAPTSLPGVLGRHDRRHRGGLHRAKKSGIKLQRGKRVELSINGALRVIAL
jgi:hypothetical protein